LNEALVLQQLHYLLQKSSILCDGHNWFFHTFQQWQKQSPFWSERTIIRIITKLEQEGYIISSKDYNKLNKSCMVFVCFLDLVNCVAKAFILLISSIT